MVANSSSDPATAHAPARSKPPAKTEHRLQQVLLVLVEQVVGPLHRVAQRLMAFQPAPRPDQQPEPVIEAIPHLGHRHRYHPRRGQLDRQRNPVEAPADLHHRSRFQRDTGRRGFGALDEQRRGGGVGFAFACPATAPATVVRRRPADPSRLVARILTVAERERIASTMSAAASRTCSQLSSTSSLDRPSNAAATLSARVIPGLLGDAQHRGDRVGHRRRIGRPPPARLPIRRRGNRAPARAATSSASRVLPTPPTPVKVTSRCALSAEATSASSDSRPIRLRGRWPQVARRRIRGLQRRKLRGQTRPLGPGTPRPAWRCRAAAATPAR